jgi:polyphenol oxidase
MIRLESQGLVYYQSEMLNRAGVKNFFLTRAGGFGKGEFAELNLSLRVGDDPELVRKNHEKLKQALGIKFLATVHQVHGSRVLDLDQEPLDAERLRLVEADAIALTRSDVAAGVLVADCYPLMLFEQEKKILVVAHCGWRGIVGGMVENAAAAILAKGGASANIIAAIGPGVCAKCYHVDEKTVSEFERRFPRGEGKIWIKTEAGYDLNLKAAMVSALNGLGIGRGQTDDLGLCTCCNAEFFSHRRDRGKTGRQIAMVVL